MADDRGPDGSEGEERPDEQTGDETGEQRPALTSRRRRRAGRTTTSPAATRWTPPSACRCAAAAATSSDPFGGLPDLPGFGAASERAPVARAGFGGGDLGAMLEQVLGEAANNPELAEVMRSMGVDPTDPATQAAMRAQLGTFMQAQQSPTGSRDLATEVARKHVLASEGNDVHDAAASRAVADAVAVATLWLDEQTTLAAPAWRATGLSRAEWVEATMPRWFELIEPVSDGVTAATSDALRKQMGELGPEAFGEALPPGLPEGFDPRAMVEQWAPMLGNLSRQMFSAQLGQAVGTLATEVVGGTEVGLPLTEPGLVALLPGNVAALAESLEIDLPQVRLYLAVREAARVRLFSEVPWLGPQLLSAVDDYARNITIDTEAIESALTTIDASDPEALRGALQGNLFRPHPTPAQQARADPPRDAPRARRGLGRPRQRPRHRHPPAPVGRARRDDPPPSGRRCGAEDLRRSRRARAAPAAAARRREPLGRARERRRRRPARQPLGPPRPRAHGGRPRRPDRLRRARHRRLGRSRGRVDRRRRVRGDASSRPSGRGHRGRRLERPRRGAPRHLRGGRPRPRGRR